MKIKKKDEKIDKYQDLAREQKRWKSMKVTVIPTVVDPTKGLEKCLEALESKGRMDVV